MYNKPFLIKMKLSQFKELIQEEISNALNERELEVGKAIGNIPPGVDRNRSIEFDKTSFNALAKTLQPLNNQEKAEYLFKVIKKLDLDRYTTIAYLRQLLQELP